MKTANKLWNWCIKSSIPGAFLPVIENFRRQFFLTQLTAPQSPRMNFSIDVGDKPGIEFLSFLQASNNVCRTLFSKNAKTAKLSII